MTTKGAIDNPPAIQSRLFKFDRYLRWSPLVFTVIIIPTTPYFVSQNFEQLYQQLAMETDIPTSVSGGCLCEKIRYTVTFPKGHSFIDAVSCDKKHKYINKFHFVGP